MTDADDIIGRFLPGITDTTKKWQSLPCKVKTMQYDVSDFMAQCVESYVTLAGKPATCLSKVATPFFDESTAWCPPEGPPTRALAPIALKVLMKVLYAARVARPDLTIASDLHDGTKGNEVGRRLRPPTPQADVLHKLH